MISIRSPGSYTGSRPPAALETIRTFTPNPANTRIGKTDLLGRIAFIEMEPALQGDYRSAGQGPPNQVALMGFHGGMGEIGDLFIGNGPGLFDPAGRTAQTGAQDKSDGDLAVNFFLQEGECF